MQMDFQSPSKLLTYQVYNMSKKKKTFSLNIAKTNILSLISLHFILHLRLVFFEYNNSFLFTHLERTIYHMINGIIKCLSHLWFIYDLILIPIGQNIISLELTKSEVWNEIKFLLYDFSLVLMYQKYSLKNAQENFKILDKCILLNNNIRGETSLQDWDFRQFNLVFLTPLASHTQLGHRLSPAGYLDMFYLHK